MIAHEQSYLQLLLYKKDHLHLEVLLEVVAVRLVVPDWLCLLQLKLLIVEPEY